MNTPDERIQATRRKFGFTQEKFCEKTGIPIGTLRSWEYRTVPISEKAAQRLIDSFLKLGVVVSKDWLLYGHGTFPKSFEEIQRETTQEGEFPTPLEEAHRFKQGNDNHEIFIHTDNSLEFDYPQGTIFGGILIHPRSWYKYVGGLVMAKGADSTMYCRKLFCGQDPDHFNLVALNPQIKDSVIYNEKITALYEINWMRKP